MSHRATIIMRQPTITAHLDDVRLLMRAFVRWHRQRHVENLALIDEYFNVPAFEEELRSLPGKYAPQLWVDNFLLSTDAERKERAVDAQMTDPQPVTGQETSCYLFCIDKMIISFNFTLSSEVRPRISLF